MSVLFSEYDLLADSDLFDADFYRRSNPEIAALNIDPLMHYLEQGCRERRDPSAQFDTAHYLSLCRSVGEAPVNPLAHYLTVGIKRGLTTKPGMAQAPHNARMLCVDIPRVVGGAAEAAVVGGLSIVGWGVVSGGVASIDIALDDVRVAAARCGLRRPDVAAAHPEWPESLLSGYAAHLPPKALTVGPHRVAISMRDQRGELTRAEFSIDVQEAADDRGPGSLRRKMPQAEVDSKHELLRRLDWLPTFRVYLRVTRENLERARRTLESLALQRYARWELHVIAEAARAKKLFGDLRAGYDAVRERIRLAAQPEPTPPLTFVARLAAGDEWGCDALLEMAVASAQNPQAEFLYCDDRRIDPVSGKADAYFKPGWSPDLLLATNYLGRAWYAAGRLWDGLGLTAAQIGAAGEHDLVLRLSEGTSAVHHVPKLLQRAEAVGDGDARQRQALRDALERRGIAGEVAAGRVQGHFRIRRPFPGGRVSIIIPTCGAEDLVKTCIDSLRSTTAYRDYEILAIENIPGAKKELKRWLRQQAQGVIESREPFNWSRYNNVAAARASGEYLLFLNDDVEIIDPEWLEALLQQAARPEVGVVGPLLLYGDLSVQHAGVMLDSAGRGLHAFRHLPENDAGYFGLALTERNVISVTGACLLTRRATFAALGGFNEAHAVINNDLDYCLKAWHSGLLNVFTPHARLIHHELKSRKLLEERYDETAFTQRWRTLIAHGDPYFNRNLSREHEQFTIEREPVEIIHAGHPLFAMESIRQILVVKLDHIGDCITALPALRRLNRHFPQAHITVLAGPATASIWRAEVAVDEILEFNYFHARSGLGKVEVSMRERAALERTLRAKRFDLAIDLRKQPDSREILALSGAAVLAGFDSHGRFPWLDVGLEWDEDVPLRSKRGHVADDLIALVDAVLTQGDPERAAFISPPSGALALPKREQQRLFSRPLICVHPAAGSPMRQWAPQSFAALIQLLLQLDRFNVALIGGSDEVALALEVLRGIDRPSEVFNLVGRFGLDELPKLLVRASLFVGNNSGPQHLAAGLGVATIGIHSGVVDAHEWGPLGPKAVAIRRHMSCSPCFIENPKDCTRGIACLTELPVGEVLRACLQALGGS